MSRPSPLRSIRVRRVKNAFLLILSVSLAGSLAFTQDASVSGANMAELRKKANEGSAEAQIALARAYADGKGVLQSDELAVKWYQKAAEQDNADAEYHLGLMYRSGRGVEQNKGEAVSWYRKAAKQRYGAAMFNLGTAYYNGDGVPIDVAMAYAWFLVAADYGSKMAEDAIDHIRGDVNSPENVVFERIGDMYEEGNELPQSDSEAIRWYRKATAGGDVHLDMKLAGLLEKTGEPESYPEIFQLCKHAADGLYPPGTYCVAALYRQGRGVPRDLPMSARWMIEAANMGHVDAMLELGEMYWNGMGVKRDKISAYEYVMLASTAKGLSEAGRQKELFEKEMTNKEITRGKQKAMEWVRDHHNTLVLRKSK
jgi:TPR repeat protein